MNSYGPNNGLFEIPFSLFGTLFTKYAIIDLTEEEYVTHYRNRVMD